MLIVRQPLSYCIQFGSHVILPSVSLSSALKPFGSVAPQPIRDCIMPNLITQLRFVPLVVVVVVLSTKKG